VEQRIESLAQITQPVERRIGALGIEKLSHVLAQLTLRQTIAQSLYHPLSRGADASAHPVSIQCEQSPSQFGHGATAQRTRAMPTRPPYDRLARADSFLGNHNGVEPPTADVPRKSTALAQSMPNATEELGPIVNEPSGSLEPAGLFVADHRNHDVSGRRPPLGDESKGRHDHHRDAALHVDSAATPEVAI